MTAVPVADVDPERVLRVVDDHNGVARLENIVEEIDADHADLRDPLVRLVEQGDVALFPVGDSVQVRREG